MMRTACLLCACGLLVFPSQGLGAVAAGQQAGDPAAQQTPAGGREVQTDVVGLELTGPMPFEQVLIEDFDSVATPSGDHLVPLRRLLGALQIESTYKDGRLSFSPKTAGRPLDVVVDTTGHLISINDQSQPIVLVAGVSDLTKNDEVYVGVEAVALSLSIELAWDEQKFGFMGKTEQTFALWKHFSENLMAIQTVRVPTNLPELFGPARPRGLSLDFVEFELRPYITATGTQSPVPATLAIDSPKETIWGSALGGRYRLQIGQPLTGNGWGTHGGGVSPITLDQFEWTHTFQRAEIAVGDSVYGVSDLIFPAMRASGVRFSGVMGFAVDTSNGRAPGASSSFSRAQVFEGEAPNGSRVELILNGRSIETQTVVSGSYRFDAVRLVPGTLNSIRIKITEPSGVERVIERSVFGRSIQLPKHGVAHLGGVGTNRDPRQWTTWGMTGAERVLYGVTDSLTIGTTWAAQQGSGPLAAAVLTSAGPAYPESSFHRGGQISWVPSEHLQLFGDVALSNTQRDHVSDAGRAYRVTADLFPKRDMRLSGQLFNYSPAFFNGNNVLLSDRAGFTYDFSWKVNNRLRANSSGGSIRNNVGGQATDPFRLDLQKLEVVVGITPRWAAIVGANRVVNTQSPGAPMLYTLRVQATPYKGINIDASFSKGAPVQRSTETELSNGLAIPGFSAYQLQVASGVVRIPLGEANALGASYYRGPGGNRTSVMESLSPRTSPLRLTTEFGYDAMTHLPFFSERSEYRFDRAGRKAVGVDVRHEFGRWTSLVNVTFGALFRNDGGIPRPLADPSFTPDNGAIYGRVFVDANADGMRDPDEPGLEGVQVVSDNGTKAVTDKNGRFVIPAAGQAASYRVFLDIDTVPADYSPTHGIQTANVRSGNLTEINLGVTPLNSVSGVVERPPTEKGDRPIAGARVLLKRVSDGKVVAESVTGNDGDYYLSDIRPGRYSVQVEPGTLPAGTIITEQPRIEIRSSAQPQDLKLSPIQVQQSQ